MSLKMIIQIILLSILSVKVHAEVTLQGVDFKICLSDSSKKCVQLKTDLVQMSSFKNLYAFGKHTLIFLDDKTKQIEGISGYVDLEDKFIYCLFEDEKKIKKEFMINLETLKVQEF